LAEVRVTSSYVWVADAVLMLSLTATVITDLRWRRIPDWITGPTLLAGLVLAFAQGGLGASWDSVGLAGSLVGLVIGAGPLALLSYDHIHADEAPDEPLYRRAWYSLGSRGVGFGDIKIMAAVGAVLGARPTIGAFCCVAVVGGVQGVVAVIARTKPGRAVAAAAGFRGASSPDFGKTVPYGVAIAVGTLAFRFWQHLGPPV
jgi:prepilin peptidase CpaA